MTKHIKFISLATTLVLVGLVALSVSAYSAPPTGTPPDCPSDNPACNPPINVGSVTQQKQGGIITVLENISTFMKFVNLSDGRENVPVKSKWGGAGDKFILRLGDEAGTLFPVSIGLAASHLWNSVPTGLFYAWYINGVEKMRLTDTTLDISGQIKIRGGNPGAGKVLVSDATGLASWQTGYGGGDGLWETIVGTTNIKNKNTGNVGIGANLIIPNGYLGIGNDGRVLSPWANALHFSVANGKTTGTGNIKFFFGGNGSNSGEEYFMSASEFRPSTRGGATLGNASAPWGNIYSSAVLELGTGITKETNAGKLIYQGFSTGLDIIGAGTTAGSRLVKLWDNINVPGSVSTTNLSTTNLSTTNLCTTAGSCTTVESIINNTEGGGGSLTPGGLGFDVNGDGFVNSSDAQVVNACVLNAASCTDIYRLRSDLNRDEVINAGDVQMINNAVTQLSGSGLFSGSGLWGTITGTNNIENKNSGNVGIGTAAPQTKLDVNGSIFSKGLAVNGSVAIVDGTQGEGKIFVSDAAGLGSWKTPSELGIIRTNRSCPYRQYVTGISADGSLVCKPLGLYQCPKIPNDLGCRTAAPTSTCTGQVATSRNCTYYSLTGLYCTRSESSCTLIK